VGAGKGVQEALEVGSALQRQGGQLQSHDPAFGACLQGSDRLRRQVELPHLPEEGRRLTGGEAQVGRSKLGQLAAGAQPGQGQRRVDAAGDDQVQRRGDMAQQEGQAVMDGHRVDQVVVVQDQHQLPGLGLELVDQGSYHAPAR
jgi:hypothetical protein